MRTSFVTVALLLAAIVTFAASDGPQWRGMRRQALRYDTATEVTVRGAVWTSNRSATGWACAISPARMSFSRQSKRRLRSIS